MIPLHLDHHADCRRTRCFNRNLKYSLARPPRQDINSICWVVALCSFHFIHNPRQRDVYQSCVLPQSISTLRILKGQSIRLIAVSREYNKTHSIELKRCHHPLKIAARQTICRCAAALSPVRKPQITNYREGEKEGHSISLFCLQVTLIALIDYKNKQTDRQSLSHLSPSLIDISIIIPLSATRRTPTNTVTHSQCESRC